MRVIAAVVLGEVAGFIAAFSGPGLAILAGAIVGGFAGFLDYKYDKYKRSHDELRAIKGQQ